MQYYTIVVYLHQKQTLKLNTMTHEERIQNGTKEVKTIISNGLSREYNSFKIDYNTLKEMTSLTSEELNECLNSITQYKVWEIVENYE